MVEWKVSGHVSSYGWPIDTPQQTQSYRSKLFPTRKYDPKLVSTRSMDLSKLVKVEQGKRKAK